MKEFDSFFDKYLSYSTYSDKQKIYIKTSCGVMSKLETAFHTEKFTNAFAELQNNIEPFLPYIERLPYDINNNYRFNLLEIIDSEHMNEIIEHEKISLLFEVLLIIQKNNGCIDSNRYVVEIFKKNDCNNYVGEFINEEFCISLICFLQYFDIEDMFVLSFSEEFELKVKNSRKDFLKRELLVLKEKIKIYEEELERIDFLIS